MNQVAPLPGHSASPSESGCRAYWSGPEALPVERPQAMAECLADLNRPLFVLQAANGSVAMSNRGSIHYGECVPAAGASLPVLAVAWPLGPQSLGDQAFCREHGIAFPYLCGAMANGIASVALVEAAARAGVLAIFGAGGLPIDHIEQAVDTLTARLADHPWGVNLIHTPNESGHEDRVVEVLIDRQVSLVEASAYLALTPAVVRYRVHGIHRDPQGRVIAPNRIIAKASRVEVARHWFSPPPPAMLEQLQVSGHLTAEQVALASEIPMATDVTVEADSGGHTDNRPAIALLPTLMALRDRLQQQYRYREPLRVGAAGGIATPASAAAAFAMGAAYIVTGSINQACVESGSSELVRQMLAEAGQADVTMAPAVDMFEMGVQLQVLKRGTLFAMRARRLYALYRDHDSVEAIPPALRTQLEKTVFGLSLDAVWAETQDFFSTRDPAQLERAATDPKHRLALICRWYLGCSSRWANAGVAERKADFQIWCGPAMGAFNEWTANSFLAQPERRTVATVAANLLFGAALHTRLQHLHQQGVRLPETLKQIHPIEVIGPAECWS